MVQKIEEKESVFLGIGLHLTAEERSKADIEGIGISIGFLSRD